jgi:homoserine/homoserine lactone efflux protein
MDLSHWLTFFVAAWAISISPGPGAVAAMSAGLNYGFKRGYFTTFGLVLGIWTQLLVVSVGLGAVVAASNTAFLIVKWAGVAYLVWLGIAQWRAVPAPLVTQDAPASLMRRRDMVLRGWMINAVNPKGTVFMLAVVPQFLLLGQALLPQYLLIGATLSFTDLVVMAGYTTMAARLLAALREPAHIRAVNRIFGSLFVLAGSLLALFKRAAM